MRIRNFPLSVVSRRIVTSRAGGFARARKPEFSNTGESGHLTALRVRRRTNDPGSRWNDLQDIAKLVHTKRGSASHAQGSRARRAATEEMSLDIPRLCRPTANQLIGSYWLDPALRFMDSSIARVSRALSPGVVFTRPLWLIPISRNGWTRTAGHGRQHRACQSGSQP